MIGNRIGDRYDIIGTIGEGGMSKVYVAHDVILNRDVAIKVLNYDFANEEELKRRFQREALSATSLTHANIVNIFDVGEEDELHYLVMEYVKGLTLKRFILENGPLEPEKAIPIMLQLVSAISNAHHNGIIHRDVKPQNILMDEDGDVKITDFGIAMALTATSHTKTNSVLGTVHYLSPEQARGGMATKKSDIYSLGIVFYELLTGKLPFSAESAVAIALKHLQEETPSVRADFPSIPQCVENVILKATAKDARHRYVSADAMYDDLLTVLDPSRADEPKFVIPFDEDETRALPIIKDAPNLLDSEQTVKMEPVRIEPDPVKQEPVQKKKKRKKWPIVASLAILIAAAIAVLYLTGVFDQQVAVPDVLGKDEADAIALLEEKGFVIDDKVPQPSEEYEKGEVFRTIPEANKERDKGSAVKLYISTGKETTTFSDYIGRDYDSIKERLEPYKFKSIKPEEVYDDQPKGTILSQDPDPDSEVVPSETDVIFTVSKGQETRTLESLIGYTDDQLTRYARSSGFNITVVKKRNSDTIPAGQVMKQEPTAGQSLPIGSEVNVTISKGPAQKRVKLFVKRVKIPYEVMEDDGSSGDGEEDRVPQTVRIYIQDRENSMTDPIKEFDITEDAEEQITVELEEGQRGGYKILRGTTIIEEKTFDYKDIQ
ncbi:Stk1 family PASTA domain-containing Ser/Thr kinase [Sporosarcina gallistercoris]|uniref:non-specific serine/threonine protein kinase n=1 Tax=Sporosarcina gallistercoris TaxID=2762245 RepID=A0ABR8PG84_9BACL|nr:Stk1 family PASTA domain-containing Ser/Thr kinase [Sporosarcina gallistercoris]MBD7907177.1 Stk1 family PASTA domain-containing Ser/Thr kinase [Sporosarcina gallistercoris]